MRKSLRALVFAFLVAAFMFLVCFAYLTALNIKIKTPQTCPDEIQDEERKPSVWDDPEWWKNPWVL
jgi:hypothetical protein